MEDREVKERSEVGDGTRTKVLEVDHGYAVGTGGRRRLGMPYSSNDIVFNERGKVSDQLLLPNATQNSPRNREVVVWPNGRELLVEFFGDRRAFCVSLVVEGNGLVGRSVSTFPRETTDKDILQI